MGYILEMECSNGSKTAFKTCIRILAEEGLTTIHFEKLSYVRLFYCDDLEAFVVAEKCKPVNSVC